MLYDSISFLYYSLDLPSLSLKEVEIFKGYVSHEEELVSRSGSLVSTNTLLNDKAENVVHEPHLEITTCEINSISVEFTYINTVTITIYPLLVLIEEVNIERTMHFLPSEIF